MPTLFSRRLSLLGVALLVALGGSGCTGVLNLMALPAIFAGSEYIPAKVKLGGNRADPTKILVISYANTDLRWGNDSVDDELTSMLSAELAKEGKFKIIPERKVRAWRDLHPRWASKSLQAIGEEFEADFVVLLEVTDFNVSDPRSPFLLQGKADVTVKVHDIKKDMIIHREIYTREFPSTGPIPLTDVPSQDSFKLRFLQTSARELSWIFIAHPTTDIKADPL